MSVGKFFKAIWHGIEHIFGKQNLENLAHDGEAILATAAGKVALDVVTNLNATTLTNTEKRDAAVSQVKSGLAAQGHTVADSFINLLVEFAVQAVKGQLAHLASSQGPTGTISG